MTASQGGSGTASTAVFVEVSLELGVKTCSRQERCRLGSRPIDCSMRIEGAKQVNNLARSLARILATADFEAVMRRHHFDLGLYQMRLYI